MDMNLLVLLAILLMLAAIAAAVLARLQHPPRAGRRSGPQSARAVERSGDWPRAEAEAPGRGRAARRLEILPLAPHEAQRFRMEWQGLQARFMDSPRTAVAEADLLVRDVMMRRGYPMGDFDSQAGDLSVEHPAVVEHFRAAHAIALRERRGDADIEALRQALVHYGALFSDLLDPPAPARPARVQDRRAEKGRGSLLRERAMARDEAATRDRERRRER